MEPRVQYAMTGDGVRIAFTVTGSGPPLVYLQPHSHTLREWELPETRDWYTLLAGRHRLIRLDIRRFGLSQRDAGPITIGTCLADVEAVVCRLGLQRFDLLGVSGLSAIAAVYAARHLDQVERLIMWGPAATMAAWRARPWAEGRNRALSLLGNVAPEVALELHARFIFGDDPPPRADQVAYHAAALGPEDYVAYDAFLNELDVWQVFPAVIAPTLAVFTRCSRYMSIEHAERIAAAIPNCQFLDCDAEMYPFLGPDQDHNLRVIEDFLSPVAEARSLETAATPSASMPGTLTVREVEVLTLLARGRTNHEIAASLGLSPQTVDRHVANIYAKAGVHNRAEATMWAVSHGIVKPEPST